MDSVRVVMCQGVFFLVVLTDTNFDSFFVFDCIFWNPVIMSHFDAFGGPHWGPRSDAVGYDDLVQAATGIMVRFGGSLKTPAEHAHLGTVDVVSGFSGCLSTCLSVFKRLRTGVCDVARTSLASNAQLIQTPYMNDWVGKDPALVNNEPAGPYAVGENWLYRW